MSFAFDWSAFANEKHFQAHVRSMLTSALNRSRPSILEDNIKLKDLEWGRTAPRLEILEIGDVASDRFRGIFKVHYQGEASITLATKVQANLLNVYEKGAPKFTSPKMVGAPMSFSIPLHLTLSDIRLNGIVILVFSKAKGLTLVFRNDPLESVKVSSTFDGFPGIADFLQSQIETQISGIFREELPGVLHRASQQWAAKSEIGTNLRLPRSDSISQPQKPVRFADIDADKQVSLVNILHAEAMVQTRRTLAISTPTIRSAVIRSELSRLRATQGKEHVKLLGDAMFQHLHAQAAHTISTHAITGRKPFKPKRRTFNLRHRHHSENTERMEATDSDEGLESPDSSNTSSTERSEETPPPLRMNIKGLLAQPLNIHPPPPIHTLKRFYPIEIPNEAPPSYVASL